MAIPIRIMLGGLTRPLSVSRFRTLVE